MAFWPSERIACMPYCPKCDMEFVEGMTVCTDCGGPLVESKEAADALKQAEKEREEQEMARRYAEILKNNSEAAAEDTEPQAKKAASAVSVPAYVNKKQRYEDMSSSASAFFLVGGILALFAILNILGVIRLPMAGITGVIFRGLLVLMAVCSIAIAVSSKKRAAQLKVQADEEEKETQEIIQWFLKTYSADGLDDQLHLEDPELAGEELSLKRFELIQDYLVTGRDLPDPSYVDALCDMLYNRLYGES